MASTDSQKASCRMTTRLTPDFSEDEKRIRDNVHIMERLCMPPATTELYRAEVVPLLELLDAERLRIRELESQVEALKAGQQQQLMLHKAECAGSENQIAELHQKVARQAVTIGEYQEELRMLILDKTYLEECIGLLEEGASELASVRELYAGAQAEVDSRGLNLQETGRELAAAKQQVEALSRHVGMATKVMEQYIRDLKRAKDAGGIGTNTADLIGLLEGYLESLALREQS